MSKTTLTFRIIEPTGSDTPRVEAFTQAVVKIGRIASQHVRLEDDDVSGMHAVVEATDAGEVTIIDLGSKSGTFVNGQQINKTTLQSGDQIRVGQTVLTVEIAAAKAAVSVAPAPEVARAPVGGSLPAPHLPGFAVPGSAAHAGIEDDGARYRYGIAANGPALRTDEVETGDRAVEVVVMWGLGDEANVLHVAHLNPPRTYYIGDETNEKGKLTTDFLVAGDALGTSRYPVVIDTGSGAAIVVPKGAKGILQTTEGVQTMEQLRASGKLVPCTELAGAEQLPIPSGATARIEHRGMTFIVRPVSAAKRIGGTTFTAATLLSSLIALCVIGSMSLHGVFLLAMYFMPPGSSSLSLDELMADRRLARYLSEPPETVEEETPEDFLQEKKDDEGGKGKRHKLEEGAMGKESSKKTNNKFGIKGPQDNEDPHMAREAAMEQAKTAGILGTLRQVMGAWNSPTSPFGRETALGADSMSALGALMGDQIGENFGYGGLGLRGTGRGGGGTGEGTIGLGNVGTIGHGAGGGSGSGYGGGAGGFGGRQTKVPKIRQGNADVRGSLSKEVIRRVIQRHINEVRFCYEQELNQRPDLAGRVTVSFVISATGAVQTAAVASSDLGAPRVDQCVATAVRRWTFPAPEGGGVVLVNYPFAFEQAGGQ